MSALKSAKAAALSRASGRSLSVAPCIGRRHLARGCVARVSEAEEAASPADAAVAEEVLEEVSLEDDAAAAVVVEDFQFSYSQAKKDNDWQPSDVEAALRYYADGAGDLPCETDHVENVTGIEDAQVFDELDNHDAYLRDEYATAGIPEAAPKGKGRRDDADDNRSGLSAEMQAIEDAKVIADALDQAGFGDDEDIDVKDAPWTWGEGGAVELAGPAAVAAAAAASNGGRSAVLDEDGVLASLSVLDPAAMEELEPDTKELVALVAEGLEADIDLLDADAAELADADAGAAELTDAEAAAIEAALSAGDLGDLLPAADAAALFDAASAVLDDDGAEPLSDVDVQAYLSALRSAASAAGGDQATVTEAVGAGAEPAAPAGAAIDLSKLVVPDLPASLLTPDAKFEAALDADEAAAAEGAALVGRVAAQLAELEAVPAVEYLGAMFPEDADLAVFEQLLDATDEYVGQMAALGDDVSAPVEPAAAAGVSVNMYDELDESLLGRAYVEAGARSAELEEGDGRDFVERILELARVTKVVKGGKIMGFRAVAVIGNGAGRVGIGCASGREVGTASARAIVDAKKNLITVPLVRDGTIPTRVETWSKGAGVVMLPASAGTGVIAGGAIKSVLELAGVQNVLAKRLGSRSTLNNARVTIKALSQLRTLDDVARARDLPLDYLLS